MTEIVSTKPLEDLSFEEALKELETLVRRLETGEENLEASMKAYERGTALKALCEKKLKEAELVMEKITTGPSGDVTTSPASFTE